MEWPMDHSTIPLAISHQPLFREFLRQRDPLSLRRELLVRAPMGSRLLRLPHLLEDHRQVEVRVGVERIQVQSLQVARLRILETAKVVIDVAEVEVGLEEIRLEADRARVERLRIVSLAAAVMDVGEVDQRRDGKGIEPEG